MVNSRMTNFPLILGVEVSVCQIGAVEVFMPLPILRESEPSQFDKRLRHSRTYPKMIRPTNI